MEIQEMTKERLEFLKANRPATIIVGGGNIKNGIVNFNRLNVKASNGKESFVMYHLTEKGYYSNKAINIEGLNERLEVIKFPNGSQRYVIVISDSEYEALKEVYDVTGKIWQTENQRARSAQASAMVFLAQRIDFHDRG